MDIYLHGFDWAVYAEQVMPAFERWLIDKNESDVLALYAKTRCAAEEEYLPKPMQRIRTWLRAKEFIDGLPRGPHSRVEYARLCSAEQFTSFSDRFLNQYTPQLYQQSPTLRTVWGALIETNCLIQLYTENKQTDVEGESEEATRGEVIALLHAVGLDDVTREEFDEQAIAAAAIGKTSANANDIDPYANDGMGSKPAGILLGQQANMLRLRGWLATVSLRAMALFELLACGRRRMPFGYDANDPYGAYYGYLTPIETWQLALALHDAHPYSQAQAERDYQLFCTERITVLHPAARLLDEVLPEHTRELLRCVRRAAMLGLGLIVATD